ncbi:MAG TPA: hypothetical protein VGT78_12475 [Rhizomicrobium sp.]|nr:hypothetical protein [Rhizomicrobium sp.]
MRAVFVAALGILVLSILSGCDLVHAPTVRTAAAAQQPCNCIPPAPEHLTRLEPPAPHYYRHHYRHRDYHHRDVARGYGYSSHSYREYESAEMAQYEYRSASSVSSVSSGSYEGYGEADEGYAHEDRGYDRDDRDYWTDGYGRQHFSGGDVTRVASDTRKRLDPWHGYGVYCPDEDRDRYRE